MGGDNWAIVEGGGGCHLKKTDCASFREDKRLQMRDDAVHSQFCMKWLSSLSHLYKTTCPQRPCHWLLFRASFHVQAFLFMPLPRWSRLRGSPQSSAEEFAFPIWCAFPAQYSSAAQIKGQRGIHQEELFKKKKTERERGSRYKRCSSEQMIQYWWRGEAKGGTTSVTSGENQQDWTCILFQSLLLLNQGMNSCDTVGQTRPKNTVWQLQKLLPLNVHSSSRRPSHPFTPRVILGNEGNWRDWWDSTATITTVLFGLKQAATMDDYPIQ